MARAPRHRSCATAQEASEPLQVLARLLGEAAARDAIADILSDPTTAPSSTPQEDEDHG